MKIAEMLLKKYKEDSFIIQLKSRFLLFVYFSLIISIIIIIIYTAYFQLNNLSYGYSVDLMVLSFMSVILFLIIGCTVILIGGHFSLAAHSSLISLFLSIWIVMFMDRSEVVARIDTTVLIIALMSSIPFFISRSKIAVLFYYCANLAAFYAFMFYFRTELNLSASVFPEFLIENTVAFLFMGIISYNLFSINSQALERMENSNQRLARTNEELQAANEEYEAQNAELIRSKDKITESENALRQSEEKYRIIAENTADVISIMDLNFKFSFVSNTIMRLRGLTVDEAMNQTIELMLTPESLQLCLSVYEEEMQLEAAGKSDPDRTRILELQEYKKDRSIIWVEVNITFLRDNDRKPVGVLMVTRDITERKRAELRFSSMVQSLSDILLIIDGNGHITYESPSVHLTLGYQPGFFIGKSPFEYIHPDDLNATAKELGGVFRSIKDGIPTEFRYRKFDGTWAFMEALGSNQLENPGVNGIILTVRDITARKKMQEEKRILEERLQQANKMDSIGKLAGGIAHDFNNLLMGIQGYTSLTLMSLGKSHPNYEMLKMIEEQIQSGADLTRQLLGFARGGRYEVKSTDINETIEKTSLLFGRTKKEISIHRKHDKDTWNVEVDRGQMEQVFMNLYVNAWQAMPDGGVIYLETENVFLNDEQSLLNSVNSGKYVKITITDTGTGMDEKTKERIFDPFFTTKEMGRGTGLGLATVFGIIKGHKGIIDVNSKLGHGTTFSIYLPASEKEVIKEKAAIKEIIRGTENILLVDDEKIVLDVNSKLLKSMGYNTHVACSGQEALSIFMEKQNEIDLIILDMIMPGISGSELIDRIMEINSDIKILLTSGYSITGEAQKIMDRGCSGFLQKPFQLEQLARKIRDILD